MSYAGNEAPGIEQWLFATLSGDATIQASVGSGNACRVYPEHVPQGVTTFPCIVFALQGPDPDTRPVGRFRLMSTWHYLVKGIGKGGSTLPLSALVNRIDQLLDAQSGQAANTQILSCIREQPVSYPETDEGVEYRHLGYIYRIQALQTGP